MIDQSVQLAVLEASARRREKRRQFLKMAGGAAAAAGAMSLLAGCDDDDDTPTPTPTPTPAPTPTPTPTPTAAITDVDIFNFALNLEYLEGQFYHNAAYGRGLPAELLTGTGTQGEARGGRRVQFTDRAVALYAREIAMDEVAHVRFIRGVLGSAAVAQPQISIGINAAGGFTQAARAAGVVGPNEIFDPYASDENFLLAASLLTDVGVTAYQGSAGLITDLNNVIAAAGILAAESYHSGLLRSTLYAKGIADPSLNLIENQTKISDARDSLDGPEDLDQPLVLNGKANIVPADANGIVFGRTAEQVLNIVYLTPNAVVGGGFLPNGANGTIRTSGDFAAATGG